MLKASPAILFSVFMPISSVCGQAANQRGPNAATVTVPGGDTLDTCRGPKLDGSYGAARS